MAGYANIDSTWQELKPLYATIDGVQTPLQKGYANIDGVWCPLFTNQIILDNFTSGVQMAAYGAEANYASYTGYTLASNYISCWASNQAERKYWGSALATTVEPIDISGFRNISMSYNLRSSTYGASKGNIKFGLTKTRYTNAPTSINLEYYVYDFCSRHKDDYNGIFNLDVSAVTGSYYVVVQMYVLGEETGDRDDPQNGDSYRIYAYTPITLT